MTMRIRLAALGIILLLANPGWAQSTTTFDSLSPGNQKIANALFSAQNTTGTTLTPLTRDQIAGLKGTEGWGRVFKQMKADGLVQSKNLGQVVSAHRHRLNAARPGDGTAATASAATAARANRGGRTTMATSARMHGQSGGAGFAGGRGFAGGSHFGMGHGVAVSTMGRGGFGHGGMGGGFGHGGGMGGGFGGGHGGGGGGRGR
jgi:hypothetical protein